MNLTLLISLFLIGFISDIILQILAQYSETIGYFQPFWQEYTPIGAAIIAGLITLIFGGLFFLLALTIFQYLGLNSKTWTFVIFSTALAFVLGFLIDVYTNRGDWLGSAFRLWYDQMGATYAGLWSGGLTFAFTAMFISTLYIFQSIS